MDVRKQKNSNLADNVIKPAAAEILGGSQTRVTSFPAEAGKYYLVLQGHLANEAKTAYINLDVNSGGTLVSRIQWKSGVNSQWEARAACGIVKATATTVTMNAAVNYVCLTDF